MIKNKFLYFFLLIVVLSILFSNHAVYAAGNDGVDLYFFWAYGCSYCEKAQVFLVDLVRDYPQIHVHKYEVYLDAENREYYQDFLKAMDRTPQGLPTIVVDDKVWVGFQPEYETEITEAVENCLSNGCSVDYSIAKAPSTGNHDPDFYINLPAIGRTNLANLSLLSSTIIISLVDGVNPCSLWILTLLLSLSVYSRSRRKTFIIGSLFILISALILASFPSSELSL